MASACYPKLPRSAPCQSVSLEGGEARRADRVVRSGLVFDVGAEYLQGRAAAGDQAAGPAPEHRVAEMPPQLLAMAAEQAGRDGLEGCSRPKISRPGPTRQQVDVLGLAIELSEFAAPALETKGGAVRRASRCWGSGDGALALEPSGKEEVMKLVRARAVSERPDAVSLAWTARSRTVSIRRRGSKR